MTIQLSHYDRTFELRAGTIVQVRKIDDLVGPAIVSRFKIRTAVKSFFNYSGWRHLDSETGRYIWTTAERIL